MALPLCWLPPSPTLGSRHLIPHLSVILTPPRQLKPLTESLHVNLSALSPPPSWLPFLTATFLKERSPSPFPPPFLIPQPEAGTAQRLVSAVLVHLLSCSLERPPLWPFLSSLRPSVCLDLSARVLPPRVAEGWGQGHWHQTPWVQRSLTAYQLDCLGQVPSPWSFTLGLSCKVGRTTWKQPPRSVRI